MHLKNKKTGEILETARSATVLKGKVEAYEWFLQTKGYIEGGEE